MAPRVIMKAEFLRKEEFYAAVPYRTAHGMEVQNVRI